VKEKKVQKRYEEEFKRQAVELVIHSGKTQAQIARELGVSEYSLTLWKRDYLGRVGPAQIDGEQMSPEQMLEKIRQLQKENEYLMITPKPKPFSEPIADPLMENRINLTPGSCAKNWLTAARSVGFRTPKCSWRSCSRRD
jgi:transposase